MLKHQDEKTTITGFKSYPAHLHKVFLFSTSFLSKYQWMCEYKTK